MFSKNGGAFFEQNLFSTISSQSKLIMKKILLMAIIGMITLSCSKDDANSNAKIIGKWKWEVSSGGIAGTTETPQSTGQSRKLEISADSIKSYVNGTLNFKTKYTIETRASLIFNEPRQMIIQENGFRQLFNLSENKLFLVGDCNDCFINEYIKE